MVANDLAPSNTTHKRNDMIEDPFMSPASTCSEPVISAYPGVPRPCLQKDVVVPWSSRDAAAAWQANTSHERMRPDAWQSAQYQTHKSASMSSGGDSSMNDGISSIDLEKGSLAKEQDQMRSGRDSKASRHSKHSRHDRRQSRQSRQSRHPSRDPEKTVYQQRRHDSLQNPTPDYASEDHLQEDDDYEVKEGLRLQEEKAVHILCFLSAPAVGLSALNAVWTVIALFITALSQPVRLCARRPSFSQQLGGLLGPALNLQLRCIYTPLPPYANEDSTYYSATLVLAHLLSPFLAMAMAIAAWVVATYWILATVVGDPVGDDKRDDGQEAVLVLRTWWENWFVRCVRRDG